MDLIRILVIFQSFMLLFMVIPSMVLSSAPQFIGLTYALISVPLIFYVYKKGLFRPAVQIVLLVLSTLLGFLIFAPLAPYQFQQVLFGEIRKLGMPVEAVLFFLFLFILLTVIGGRAYCSAVSPIGAIQELLSKVPTPKIAIPWKRPVLIIHTIVVLIFIWVALFVPDFPVKCFGMRYFFFLEYTSMNFYLFAGIMLLGLFIYRPFCRFICPYGLFLTLASYFSLMRLTRTDACISCKQCEKICPVGEAYADSNKSECFLCGRCTQVCPIKRAFVYQKRK